MKPETSTEQCEITIDSITKQFSAKKVLQDITLSFRPGFRYALLGENGAGKSTLSRIISGSLQPDAGTVNSCGISVFCQKHAQTAGIAMVHQIPCLADHLTVLENIILGSEPTTLPAIINRKKAVSRITGLMSQWHLNLNLSASAASLTAQERFYTALLAALWKNPWFLILDEPSANLGASERDILFQTIREKTGSSTSPLTVLFITHNISEALANADETIVLRKGRISACYHRDDPRATEDALTRAIFGDSDNIKQGIRPVEIPANQIPEENRGEKDIPLFRIQDFSIQPADTPNLYNISLEIPQGSFTVITGSKESGLSTLENLLTGFCSDSASGSFDFLGKTVSSVTPALLRAMNVGIVSSDKTWRSSNPTITVRDLLISHWGKEAGILETTGIRATLHDLVGTLSGGMLQKLILTRELAHNPRALILANPGYGLDAASILALKDTLLAANRAGITIVVLSTVHDSLCDCADNRYVIESGVLTHEA